MTVLYGSLPFLKFEGNWVFDCTLDIKMDNILMLEIIQDRTILLLLCMFYDNRLVSTKLGDVKCYILLSASIFWEMIDGSNTFLSLPSVGS